ncbi:MAG TPA: BatD family protein [Anaerolineae bacterium]|nr:BatD family protein [Anaerolineae bacterium]
MKQSIDKGYSQTAGRRLKSYALVVVVALLLLTTLALPVAAQGSRVSATVDRTDVGLGETVTLSIAVEGADNQPALPPLDDFQVVGTSSGMQMRSVNGVTTTEAVTQYALQPLRAGDLTIPSFQIVVAGQVVGSTEPIVVNVTQGSSTPPQAQPGSALPPMFPNSGSGLADLLGLVDQMLQNSSALGSLSGGQTPVTPSSSLQQIPTPPALQGQDYYAEALVDKTTPYQGEQVLYTLRFYRAIDPFGRIEYKAPTFNGSWSKALPDQTGYTTEAAGRTYMVTELQHALFPMVAGEVVIDSARLTLPGDFLGASGVEVASDPVALDVQPLPAGAPASFQGAVGQFDMESEVDKAEATVGDAITQRVVISGVGNVEQITDPMWAEDPAWRAFDSNSTTDTQFRDGLLTGERRIERMLVPTEPGELTLPGAEFSYFDPAASEYRTISTEPVTLAVSPGAATPVVQQPADTGQPTIAPVVVHPDLRPIKGAAASQGIVVSPSLPQQPVYWALWALPVALVAGQAVWQRRQRLGQANVAVLRSKNAAKQASRALREAEKRPENAGEAASRILAEYMGDKLQRPVTGLTQRALADLLLVHNVSPSLVARVQALLTQCEVGRYAPADYTANGGDQLLADTQQLIDALEQQFS